MQPAEDFPLTDNPASDFADLVRNKRNLLSEFTLQGKLTQVTTSLQKNSGHFIFEGGTRRRKTAFSLRGHSHHLLSASMHQNQLTGDLGCNSSQ